MKPRVMQLIDSFHQGGTERQAVQLTRMLHESGLYDVHVACLDGAGVLRRDVERLGLDTIHEFPLVSFRHPGTARRVRQFASVLRRLNIDLLHAHDFYTNIFGMAAGLVARVPARIASRRETDPNRTRAQRFVERRAFAVAHAVVANADAVRRDLVAGGVPDGKIRTVYNGVDVARFVRDSSAGKGLASSLGLPPGGRRRLVTIVANLRLVLKDHPTFLRAARQVRTAVPDAAFVVAGEGELLATMRELARELGIASHVFFTGRCQEVPELLAASDVCVLSSVSEGFANVLVEYMAAGRPVVATDVGGAREAIEEGRNGFLVRAGDADAMAARVIQLLQDEPARLRMGEHGRALALARFSCGAQLERTHDLYKEVLRTHATPVSDAVVSGANRRAESRSSV